MEAIRQQWRDRLMMMIMKVTLVACLREKGGDVLIAAAV